MPTPSCERRAELIAAALAVRERAYAPYSQFTVGAALLTASGQIVAAANVENASYGLSICAERAAVAAAIADGERQYVALAVAAAGGAALCGACRQVLWEFAPELVVWQVDANRPEQVHEARLRELLPGAFELRRQ